MQCFKNYFVMVYIKAYYIIDEDGMIRFVRSSCLAEFLEKVKPHVFSIYSCVSHIILPLLRAWKWRTLCFYKLCISSYEKVSFKVYS